MDELVEQLAAAEATGVAAFQNAYRGGLYEGWFDVTVSDKGFVKLFDTASGASFQRWKGMSDVYKASHRNYQIITDVFNEVIEIGILDWERLIAFLGNGYGARLADASSDAAHAKDRLITDLIQAGLNNETQVNLFNDTKFWGTNIKLPSGGAKKAAGKVTNRVVAEGRDADAILDAFYKGTEAFSLMEKPNGDRYHVEGMENEGFEMLHPVNLQKVMNAVFDNGKTTSKDTTDKLVGHRTKSNGAFDQRGMDVIMMRPIQASTKMRALQIVQKSESPLFFDDFPRSAPGSFRTAEQQKTRKYTASAELEMEAGLGNIYASVMIEVPAETA